MLHEFGWVQFGLPRTKWPGLVLLPIESVYVRLRLDVLSVTLPGLGDAELILLHAISAAVMQATESSVISMSRRVETTNARCSSRCIVFLHHDFESQQCN